MTTGSPATRRPDRRHRAALAPLVLAATVLAACGAGGSDGGPCGPVTREALDSAFLVHVLPGQAPDHDYRSDPPTSGPHTPGPELADVLDVPLARPVQVGALERGDVLLQHDPDLAAGELEALRALAGGGVVVAPNPDLPSPVVATAWLHKQACEAVDADVLGRFVAARLGQAPGDDG